MNHILNPVQPNFDSYCKWRIHPFTDLDCFSRDKFSTSLHASPSSRPSAPSGSPTSKPPIAPAAGMREVLPDADVEGGTQHGTWKTTPGNGDFLFETVISWDLCLVFGGGWVKGCHFIHQFHGKTTSFATVQGAQNRRCLAQQCESELVLAWCCQIRSDSRMTDMGYHWL